MVTINYNVLTRHVECHNLHTVRHNNMNVYLPCSGFPVLSTLLTQLMLLNIFCVLRTVYVVVRFVRKLRFADTLESLSEVHVFKVPGI